MKITQIKHNVNNNYNKICYENLKRVQTKIYDTSL